MSCLDCAFRIYQNRSFSSVIIANKIFSGGQRFRFLVNRINNVFALLNKYLVLLSSCADVCTILRNGLFLMATNFGAYTLFSVIINAARVFRFFIELLVLTYKCRILFAVANHRAWLSIIDFVMLSC